MLFYFYLLHVLTTEYLSKTCRDGLSKANLMPISSRIGFFID